MLSTLALQISCKRHQRKCTERIGIFSRYWFM